jgi:hypothetical protein
MKTISPILGDLLERIYKNKKVIARELDVTSRYFWIKVARDNGFVTLNGIGDRNEHIYILTKTGIEMAELWIHMKKLMEEGKNVRQEGQKIKNVREALNGRDYVGKGDTIAY